LTADQADFFDWIDWGLRKWNTFKLRGFFIILLNEIPIPFHYLLPWSKMKQINLFVINIFLLTPHLLCAQSNYNHRRTCVKDFYNLLFSSSTSIGELETVYANGGIHKEAEQMMCDSLKANTYNYKLLAKKISSISKNSRSFLMEEIKRYFEELTNGLKLKEIEALIDKAQISNQGLNIDDYLTLEFPNKKTIYFDIGDDEPSQIAWIYLSNGDLLEGNFYNYRPEKLLLVGQISDPDGYVNVRKKPSAKAPIVSKILKGGYFFYTPDSYSDWWLIRSKENATLLGYIHRSRIENYIKFSQSLKDKVRKDRN
jgi:hypothetical protein